MKLILYFIYEFVEVSVFFGVIQFVFWCLFSFGKWIGLFLYVFIYKVKNV